MNKYTWLKQQLKQGEGEIKNPPCNCGRVSPKGIGYYCFLHKKQTPNKEV